MKHTYEQGIIGNCAFIAHIHKDTNVNFMCWPRFDSSFLFGGMLDKAKGGEFSLKPPTDDFETVQYYLPNTNVLCTEVTYEEGKYRITDFAPRFQQFERYFRPLTIIRIVEPLEGTPRMVVKCNPVYDYGRTELQKGRGSSHIKYMGMKEETRLTTDVPLVHIMDEKPTLITDKRYMYFSYGSPLEAPLESTSEIFFDRTKRYWRDWIKSTSIGNFYQEEVIRSALVLKIHQFEDTGAIIAASTTSLPESPGSTRNWDYRFCWMRDTFYTLNAVNSIGHFEEMEKYSDYIANITINDGERFQPLYKISGSAKITEEEIDLEGYLGNKPVRVGNQAYTHIQNDVYGQVLVSLFPLFTDSRFRVKIRKNAVETITHILTRIEETMHEPDAGLWEFRNLAQQHCYTFLFHWAGSSAIRKMAQKTNNAELEEYATRLRDESAAKIEECYDSERGVYTQAVGSKNLDASTLQLITMGYLDYNGDRARKHLEVMEGELKSKDGLFYRYKHSDDFGEPESTFLICAFWYVEALACVGRLDDAISNFESLMKYSNDLGLFSEDVDAKTGSQWGNFPQAYSHVGLINAAYRISKKLDLPAFL